MLRSQLIENRNRRILFKNPWRQGESCRHPKEVKVMSGTQTGTVKWFNSQKGYGFIAPSDGSKDVFVHVTEVEKAGIQLADGQKVNYEIQDGKRGKGPSAVRLSLAA
jgi:CspA family cold shock protein